MAFNTALSGLNAASSDLDIVGNNIANSNTLAFKGSSAEFADIFASNNLGVSSNAIGQGVQLSDVRQDFAQGQFEFTGNALDLAINGTGFFQLSVGGEVSYTRAGSFRTDSTGFIVNSDGQRLQGQTAVTGALTGATGDLQVSVTTVAPNPTTSITIGANVDASEAVIATAFSPTDAATYNHSTSTTVYDSLGISHLATMYYKKTANNTWDNYMYVDGVQATSGTDPSVQLNFDATGDLTSWTANAVTTASTTVTWDAVAAAPANNLTFTIDYSGLTQYGSQFGVGTLSQDGYAAGDFSDLTIDQDGNIFGRFTNGQAQLLGQLTLFRFAAQDGLRQLGNTSWGETFTSGAAIGGPPGQSGLGTIEAGALEQSNVDLTKELVGMITAQRNFQANAQMISTSDQVTQAIINIR